MTDLSPDAATGGVPTEGASAPSVTANVAPLEAVARFTGPIPVGSAAYETLVIVYARFEGDTLQALLKELKAIFTAAGASVDAVDVIGRRPLAYKIKKQSDGVYVNFVFTAPPSSIREIERDLRHHEQVMRFLTTCAVRS